MHKEGEEVHIDDSEASAGTKTGHVRWILAIGTLLAVVLLSVVWITGAATQGDVEEEATVSGIIESTDEEDGDDTDSIVGEDMTEIDGADADTTDGIETIEN